MVNRGGKKKEVAMMSASDAINSKLYVRESRSALTDLLYH